MTAACCAREDSAKPASPTRCSCARIARISLAHPQKLSPSAVRSSWRPARCSCRSRWRPSGRRTGHVSNARTRSREQAGSVARDRRRVSRTVPDRARLDGVGAHAPSGRDGARPRASRPAVRGGAARPAAAAQHRPDRSQTATSRASACPCGQSSGPSGAALRAGGRVSSGKAGRQRADDRRGVGQADGRAGVSGAPGRGERVVGVLALGLNLDASCRRCSATCRCRKDRSSR